MFLNKSRKVKFQFQTSLEYDWIGTISWYHKLYKVYRAEGFAYLPKNMLTIIFKITSENKEDQYVVIGRKDPVSNYWRSSVSDDILIILENEFLSKYEKK